MNTNHKKNKNKHTKTHTQKIYIMHRKQVNSSPIFFSRVSERKQASRLLTRGSRLNVLLCEIRLALLVVGEDAEGVRGAQSEVGHYEGCDILGVNVRVLQKEEPTGVNQQVIKVGKHPISFILSC